MLKVKVSIIQFNRNHRRHHKNLNKSHTKNVHNVMYKCTHFLKNIYTTLGVDVSIFSVVLPVVDVNVFFKLVLKFKTLILMVILQFYTSNIF